MHFRGDKKSGYLSIFGCIRGDGSPPPSSRVLIEQFSVGLKTIRPCSFSMFSKKITDM